MVNLYSDTQTRPTPAMRRAMAEAEVGDEQSFADPTVTALCERVAELLGFEAAVFLPTGTMCNAIAFRLHVRPGGDEVVLHRTSHPVIAEAGGPAAISGAVLNPVEGPGGMFDAATLRGALRPPGDRYTPRSRLVSLEQTTNIAGGRVWPLEQMREVLDVARGARPARAPGRRAADERRRRVGRERRRRGRARSTPRGSTSRRGSARRWARCSPRHAS